MEGQLVQSVEWIQQKSCVTVMGGMGVSPKILAGVRCSVTEVFLTQCWVCQLHLQNPRVIVSSARPCVRHMSCNGCAECCEVLLLSCNAHVPGTQDGFI